MSGKPKTKPAKGWGGPRPGSGQPKKPRAAPVERPAISGLSAQELARLHVDLAIATLAEISSSQDSASARVAACKVILEIAKGDAKLAEDAAIKPVDRWTDLDEARPN